jgi:hypothetical protein
MDMNIRRVLIGNFGKGFIGKEIKCRSFDQGLNFAWV